MFVEVHCNGVGEAKRRGDCDAFDDGEGCCRQQRLLFFASTGRASGQVRTKLRAFTVPATGCLLVPAPSISGHGCQVPCRFQVVNDER